MRVLDRYIVRSLIVNYVIGLAVMVSLYMVLDLFVNIDEFTESDEPWSVLIGHIVQYYSAHSLLYFAQLSGVITMFACMATIARMRQANELTAVLSSGVSLYRVAVPIVAFALATSALWYVDKELLIPRIAHRLSRGHEDAAGTQSRKVAFVADGRYRLLSAIRFIPAEQRMERVLMMHRDENGGFAKMVEASAAQWEDIPGHPNGGVWRLTDGFESRRIQSDRSLGPSDDVDVQPVDVLECDLDPHDLETRQEEKWLAYLSSADLSRLANDLPVLSHRVRRAQHERFAAPLVHMLMLMLGLPFFLSRAPANVISDSGKCLVISGLCYLLAYAGENFVRTESLSALPAWMPLIVFTPVAVVLVDRMRT